MRLLNNDPRKIEDAIRGPADAPRVLAGYASTNLPDPAKYPRGLIYVSDLNALGVSNGTEWRRITLGTVI